MGKSSRIRQERDYFVPEKSRAKEEPKSFWSRTGWKIFTGVMIFLVVAMIAFSIIYSTGYLQRNTTALKIGDVKVTPMEYKVYYSLVRSNYISTNYSTLYAQYGNSLTQLDSLAYINDNTRSWGSYFSEMAVNTMTQYYILYQEAMKAGHVMSQDTKAKLDADLAQMKTAADSQKMSVDQYVKTTMGKNATFADVQKIFERRYYAQSYYETLQSSYTFTTDQLNSYYSQNRDKYDSVHYRSFIFPYEQVTYTAPKNGEKIEQAASSQEEADKMTAANKAKAEAQAKEFQSKITDEQSFITLASQYAADKDKETYKNPDATLVVGSSLSSSNSSTAEWYKDQSRKAGDTTVIRKFSELYSTPILRIVTWLIPALFQSVIYCLVPRLYRLTLQKIKRKRLKIRMRQLRSRLMICMPPGSQEKQPKTALPSLQRITPQTQVLPPKVVYIKSLHRTPWPRSSTTGVLTLPASLATPLLFKPLTVIIIMYFVAQGRPFWIVDSESGLRDQALSDYFKQKTQEYPVKVYTYPMSMA